MSQEKLSLEEMENRRLAMTTVRLITLYIDSRHGTMPRALAPVARMIDDFWDQTLTGREVKLRCHNVS